MITPEMISRINELARKKKTVGLTETEYTEQAKLRRLYLDDIKSQLRSHLDRIEIVDEETVEEEVVITQKVVH